MEIQPVYFFTATINSWKPLLIEDKYKMIILESLSFLVNQVRCKVYAFVIMPNHIHLLWQMQGKYQKEDVQRDFLKYTGQTIKLDLSRNDPNNLRQYFVGKKDRAYQIWQRNSLSVKMFSKEVMEQKLDYIHNNPVQGKWMLAQSPLGYKYSSVRFYEEGNEDEYEFLSHYMEYFE